MRRLCLFFMGILLLPGVVRGQDLKLEPSGLLRNEAVQRELKLTKEQKVAITKLMDRHRQDMLAGIKAANGGVMPRLESVGGAGPPRQDSNVTRAEASPPERSRVLSSFDLSVRQDREVRALLSPAQLKRLMGIQLQRIGPNAFLSDELCKALNIDSDKRAEIEALIDGHDVSERTRRTDDAKGIDALLKPWVKPDGKLDLDALKKARENDPSIDRRLRAASEAMTAVRLRRADLALAKILKTLTKRQQDAYRKMLGEPFNSYAPPPAAEPDPKPAAEPTVPAPKPLSERRGVPR